MAGNNYGGSPDVKHDPRGMKFYLPLGNGEEGILFYSVMNSGELDLTHTEVPPSQRGRGLGAVLAKAALEYAREKRLKVKLTCTYLQHFVSKHPEYSDLVLE